MNQIPEILIAILSTSVFASLTTTLLNNFFQSLRENKRWQREKLYELHVDAQTSLVELIKATATSLTGAEISSAFHASVAAVARLSFAYSGSEAKELAELESDLRAAYQNRLIQKYEIPLLESLLSKLYSLAQKDNRIKYLFRK